MYLIRTFVTNPTKSGRNAKLWEVAAKNEPAMFLARPWPLTLLVLPDYWKQCFFPKISPLISEVVTKRPKGYHILITLYRIMCHCPAQVKMLSHNWWHRIWHSLCGSHIRWASQLVNLPSMSEMAHNQEHLRKSSARPKHGNVLSSILLTTLYSLKVGVWLPYNHLLRGIS